MNGGTAGPADVFKTEDGVSGMDGTAVSGTTAYYSRKTDARSLFNIGYQLVWTGTPTGTFIVQCSNQAFPAESADTGWFTLTLAVAIVQPAGSATGDYVDLSALPFRWVRLRYTNASSTGRVFAYVSGKNG